MRQILKTPGLLIKTMRLHQWVKNIFIFAPMVFSLNFFQVQFLVNSTLAFLLFSLTASCIYIFNDCFDREKDRRHPEKQKRPIASGHLKIKSAAPAGIIILLLTLTATFLFNVNFFYITLFYIGMNIIYSALLKHIVILDVMVIAVGFVLRVEIGGVVNEIAIYPWILIITFLGAIFLGLIKRRQEQVKMSAMPPQDGETRITLKQYNLSLLDQLISITTATTLISYIIYVVHPDVMEKFHTEKLYFTVPFVVFGIFRYLYLTYVKGKGENPAEIIFTDIPFTINTILWVSVFMLLIYLQT